MMRLPPAAVLATTLGVAGVAAQTPPVAVPAPQSSDAISLTGCLRMGERTGMYVLTHVEAERQPAAPATAVAGEHPDTGTTRATPAPEPSGGLPGAGDTVRLAGVTARLTLNDSIGRTVTVTGRFAAEDRTVTPGVLLPDTEPDRRPAVSGRRPARVFTVSRVARVGADCPK
jgi:hypothetical protein